MAAGKNYQTMINDLKKRVRQFINKEEEGREELRRGMEKVRHLSEVYRDKLTHKVDEIQKKLSQVKSSPYAKAALDLQRQILTTIETKARALHSAVKAFEKEYRKKNSAKPSTTAKKRARPRFKKKNS